jgi:hypothetical protein
MIQSIFRSIQLRALNSANVSPVVLALARPHTHPTNEKQRAGNDERSITKHNLSNISCLLY